MKSNDEIKKDLKNTINSCLTAMTWGDPLSYPQAVFQAHETLINAYNFIKQLEAERDEAVADITRMVQDPYEPCYCDYCKLTEEECAKSNCRGRNAFEWRGVQKEE